MNQEQPIQSPNHNYVTKQVRKNTPVSVIELIASQLDRTDESKRRIVEDGIVVRNISGSVVEHPCIKIEVAATKLACDLLAKYRK